MRHLESYRGTLEASRSFVQMTRIIHTIVFALAGGLRVRVLTDLGGIERMKSTSQVTATESKDVTLVLARVRNYKSSYSDS